MTRLKFVLISLFLLLTYTESYAQNFNLSKSQSRLMVIGTSSLHDWSLDATDMRGQFKFDLDSVLHIKKLTLTVQILGLKASKKGITKKMRSTLKADKFSTITYHFKRIDKITRVSPLEFGIETTGKLTIAGMSRDIALKLFITLKENNVSIVGDKELKMTDFSIKPPKALLGLLKTGDAVKIIFDLNYQ